VNVEPPAADGDPVATSALSAQPGTWDAVELPLRFRYHWVRCDPSGGGTCTFAGWGRTYTPKNTDVGSTLRVIVDADHNGDKGTATSAPTERVAPFSPSGFWSWQLGPYAAGLDAQWTAVAAANATPPTIAVVDSGVDSSLPGLDGTVVKQVPITTLPQSASLDGYGHGSFVAQVAAGHAKGAAGASPKAPIVSLDVMNDDGMALTSDVVAAADWIYAHKAEDNIRVANFSLIGSTPSSIMFDPLDRALEKLWLSGVVVTTAAGNFAVDGQESNIPFSPANDPFVITVGASDTAGTVSAADDFAAPWSAFGHTLDGFAKPEVGAPGRYVVASVPTDSTLYTQRPDRVVGPGRLELSGTSFAAPLVAGVAANLLALHPGWTPNQVKGALMLSAKQPGAASPFALGVGEIDAAAALAISDPPNPNAALEQFLTADPAGGATQVLDTASWGTTAQANASWGTASWGTASWGTASWGTASWGTAYWSSASWGTASWGTASWGTASWGTASWGTDNATADVLPGGGYPMSWPG
jgi:serine protease AprX